eukprot:TRINITY_DN24338_c0_g1_i1.p1 TRINITY_DN24338_c0_g1~~TRINITY_DN24338_c0_g1_i1.p1  ORF type:complete len:609 (+),score=88.19 TRINITY_DN24338_c0_g1_i1:184-1827(+)
MPFVLHPTQITIHDSVFAGAVVGNLLLSVVFTIIAAIGVTLIVYLPCLKTSKNYVESSGLLRFPSCALFVFLFLYQGTTYAAARQVAYPQEQNMADFIVSGVAGLIFCLIVPVWVFRRISRDVPMHGRYRTDDVERNAFTIFIIGPGEWVSRRKEHHWVNRYKTMIASYKERNATHVYSMFGSSLMLSLAKVPYTPTMTSCGNVRLMCSIILLGLFVLDAWKRPYSRPRDIFLTSGINLSQSIGLACFAIGFYSGDLDHDGFSMGQTWLIVATVFIIIKTILDLISEAYVICSGRRERLQQQEWKESDPEMMDIPLTETKDVENEDFSGSIVSHRHGGESLSLYLTHGDSASFARPKVDDSVSSGEPAELSVRSAATSSLTRKGFTSLRESGVREILSPTRRSSNPFVSVPLPIKKAERRSFIAEPTAMPQTLVVSLAGEASSLSGSYKLDSRPGSNVWVNGISSIRRKGDSWEIREGYGEASTRIISQDLLDSRWPHEMNRWADSHGFPCDVQITAQDLQSPTKPPKSKRTAIGSSSSDPYSFLTY